MTLTNQDLVNMDLPEGHRGVILSRVKSVFGDFQPSSLSASFSASRQSQNLQENIPQPSSDDIADDYIVVESHGEETDLKDEEPSTSRTFKLENHLKILRAKLDKYETQISLREMSIAFGIPMLGTLPVVWDVFKEIFHH